MWEMANKPYEIKQNERLEVAERIAKHKKMKEEKKKEKKPCPYGCGKAWININTKSVKLHVLDKCPNRPGNEHKLAGFYKRLKTT